MALAGGDLAFLDYHPQNQTVDDVFEFLRGSLQLLIQLVCGVYLAGFRWRRGAQSSIDVQTFA